MKGGRTNKNGLELPTDVAAEANGNNRDNTPLDQIDEMQVPKFENEKGEENDLPKSKGKDIEAKYRVEETKEKEYDRDRVADEVQNSKLDDDYFDVEVILGKRRHKGQLQYLVKWLGWPEESNTWEPMENLKLVPHFIDAFEESLSSRKHRKHKRKHVAYSVQPKKRLKRSTASHNLIQFTSGRGDKHVQSTHATDLCHFNLPTSPHVLLYDDKREVDGDDNNQGKAKLNTMNGCGSASKQTVERRDENGYDTKFNEIKEPNRVDAKKLAMHFGEVKILVGNSPEKSQHKVDSNKQVQGGQLRGAKKRKSGLVKRFQKESYACGPAETQNAIKMYGNANSQALKGGDDFMGNNSHVNKTDETNLTCDLVKILKPIGYSYSTSKNKQDAPMLTFMAMRSDGSEVKVDNKYLKAHNPELLFNYYEQHFSAVHYHEQTKLLKNA